LQLIKLTLYNTVISVHNLLEHARTCSSVHLILMLVCLVVEMRFVLYELGTEFLNAVCMKVWHQKVKHGDSFIFFTLAISCLLGGRGLPVLCFVVACVLM
jgi:hypothetical protein